MRLPSFIAVGPPRTATTWLDKALRGHVGLPPQTKETHFFSRNYGRGLDWYAAHFAGLDERLVPGEICASYFENPEARARIAEHLPGCRIVCTLRDPADRIYSYYKLMRHNGRTGLPFEAALEAHPKMIAFSRYATILEAWLDRFGEDRVLVLLNDDLAAAPQAYLDRVAGFVGAGPIQAGPDLVRRNRQNTIETAPRSVFVARHARRLRSYLGARRLYRVRRGLDRMGVWRACFEGGAPYPPMSAQTRARLVERLGPEIERLEGLLGRDLAAWKA
jgi:hypothetical protein